jgi:DHA2 family methylenomycin A resistance protein-like MFS transporter
VRRAALAASSLASAVVLLDASVVNVALPAIRSDLGAGVEGLQWAVNGYTLVFAALLMSAGALADRWGAKWMLTAGTVVFGLGSVAAMAAQSIAALVVLQALLGAGAALLVPGSMSLLTHTFQTPAERARALGIWASAGAVMFAASPVIAGVLIDLFGWRGVFAVNLPFVAAVALLLPRTGSALRSAGRRFDGAGQLSAALALTALTFALIESGSQGWGDERVRVGLALALAAGAAFVAVERRAAEPMLPLGLFSRPGFSGSVAAGLLLSVSLYGQLFLLSLYLQEARGLSPVATGLVFLPQPIMTAVTGIPAGRLVGRLGARAPMLAGGACGALGALALTTLGPDTPLAFLVATLTCFGAAAGLIVPAITTAVFDGVPPAKLGVASSALNAGRQTGAVLGVALLGGLASDGDFVSGLPLAMALCALVFVAIAAIGLSMAGPTLTLDLNAGENLVD